jgi:hypothetical protein
MGWCMNISWDASYQRTHLHGFRIVPSCCCCCCAYGDIPRLMALVLRVNKLLIMTNEINGLRPSVVGHVFFLLISHSIILQL